jgi:hypothetical protein
VVDNILVVDRAVVYMQVRVARPSKAQVVVQIDLVDFQSDCAGIPRLPQLAKAAAGCYCFVFPSYSHDLLRHYTAVQTWKDPFVSKLSSQHQWNYSRIALYPNV